MHTLITDVYVARLRVTQDFKLQQPVCMLSIHDIVHNVMAWPNMHFVAGAHGTKQPCFDVFSPARRGLLVDICTWLASVFGPMSDHGQGRDGESPDHY